jgi:high-affinity iron transporter
MIPSILLSLREGLEAALIISIVGVSLRKAGRSDLNRSLWMGIIAAAITSLAAALLLRSVDAELDGVSEQIFEGITFLLAAAVLTWMIFWMQSESHYMKSRLEDRVNRAMKATSSGAIFFVSFLAVLREGIELALYLTAVSLSLSGIQILLGTAIGFSIAWLIAYLIYSASLRLNLPRFFQVSGLLLILFAAGLVGRSVAEFNEAGIIPAVISPVWNLNPFLNDHSMLGTVFSTLFGYHSNPSLTEALGYSAYVLIVIIAFIKARKLQPA